MRMKSRSVRRTGWIRIVPPLTWLAEYQRSWLPHDALAGLTLAAYAIPVSLAYAGLAGLPPQVGIYGYMLGGIGYALLGSSRQLAVGPTSAISLMIAGTVGSLAGGDALRYAEIASLLACAVALLCLIAWLFRLSILVRLVSDSILVGFKAGAGLTIIMSQLPSLFGVAGGGHNFFDRIIRFAGQLGDISLPVSAIGIAAILLLLGLTVFGWAGYEWSKVGFGDLTSPHIARIVISGLTLTVISIQLGFGAFLLGVLAIPVVGRKS